MLVEPDNLDIYLAMHQLHCRARADTVKAEQAVTRQRCRSKWIGNQTISRGLAMMKHMHITLQ